MEHILTHQNMIIIIFVFILLGIKICSSAKRSNTNGPKMKHGLTTYLKELRES